jgi:hypothetical protein
MLVWRKNKEIFENKYLNGIIKWIAKMLSVMYVL